MFLLCQEKVQRADAVLLGRGATFSFKWSCYAACIFTWLTAQGMELKDVEQTNLGMRMEDVAKPCPALRLYDLLSWRRKTKPSCAWSGFHALMLQTCPLHHGWIKDACATAVTSPQATFKKLASECQSYHDLLMDAEVMDEDGNMSGRSPIPRT